MKAKKTLSDANVSYNEWSDVSDESISDSNKLVQEIKEKQKQKEMVADFLKPLPKQAPKIGSKLP